MYPKGHDQSKYSKDIVNRIESVVLNIVDAFDPTEIILYGSYARGDYDSTSDIDLIVLAETTLRFQDRSLRALDIIKGQDDEIAVNPLVYTPSEFKNMIETKESFLVTALKESKILWKKEAGCGVQTQLESPQFDSDFKQYL